MKKQLLYLGIVCCSMLVVFTGCKKTSKTTEEIEVASDTSLLTNTTKEGTTEKSETITTEDLADADHNNSTEALSNDGSAPTIDEAKEIIDALDLIDKIGAGILPYDDSCKYSIDEATNYYKVVETQFNKTDDIRTFMNNYMTKEMIENRYLNILDGEQPMCIDIDGELYIKDYPIGGGFAFSESEPQIEKTSEEGYSILAEYDNYGALECMDIGIKKEEGKWKIYNITFGK